MPHRLLLPGLAILLLPWLGSCGEHHDQPPPPTAFDQSFGMFEDDSLSSALDADVDFGSSDFIILAAPLDGSLDLDPVTGDFTYTPDAGFIGSDNFIWEVEDRYGVSNSAQVDFDVQPHTVQLIIHVPGEPLLATRR